MRKLFLTLFAITIGFFGNSQDFENAKFKIKNMGTYSNTKYSDYGPVITADESYLYFTSKRPLTEKGKSREREEFEMIYRIKKRSSRSWLRAELMPEPINRPFSNNSVLGISNDGQVMLIYRDTLGKGDIYESKLNGDVWSNPKSLGAPICLPESHESTASIAPDGKTIYFISDRAGGKGGRDIYRCTKQNDGSWGSIENLGDSINTLEDEEAVYIHPDGRTLYFSSKGHESMGGYDIYYSVYEDDHWTTPENLGEPINTEADDYFLVVAASGTTAYYSTEKGRSGRGMTDIYQITFKAPKRKTYVTVLKGVVTDAKTSKPVEAKIEIIDNVKGEVISEFHSNSATGEYLISLPSGKNYGISVEGEGYLFHSENFDLPKDKEYQEVVKDIALDKVEIGKKIVLRNIFYEVGKATLTDESISELEKLHLILDENPKMKIEISGHTDDVGSDDYNQKLSEERAHSVVNYLIEKGVAEDRLTYKGYGETQPMVPNMNEDGTPNEENRAQNRRTEFQIISNE